MIIGTFTAQLHLQGIGSLKEKRSIVKSLVERLKSRFNASVAEVDHNDSKISAVIGAAMVANDTRFVNQQMDSMIEFMRNDGRFYLANIERETF